MTQPLLGVSSCVLPLVTEHPDQSQDLMLGSLFPHFFAKLLARGLKARELKLQLEVHWRHTAWGLSFGCVAVLQRSASPAVFKLQTSKAQAFCCQ